VKVQIADEVKDFLRLLSEKDRHIVGEHINRLTDHPNVLGDVKKLKIKYPQWRFHISSRYTLFYHVEGDTVCIDHMLTMERAHKKYGKI
jgi:mRNA-degrading endonuclease RelE of RelBE toxin-antitoxin system